MFVWSIQITIISIILIFLVHHIIHFLKSTLTVPKIKDLVHSPLQKYENIIQNMSESKSNYHFTSEKKKEKEKESDLSITDMKEELKNFLKSQFKNDNTTDISLLESL